MALFFFTISTLNIYVHLQLIKCTDLSFEINTKCFLILENVMKV